MSDQDYNLNPERTAFHDNKRELLRRGLEQGMLDWKEIVEALPAEYITDVEMEVFLFTCANLGIAIKNRPS